MAFEDSRRKIARAKDHIADLERHVVAFENCGAYKTVAETDPNFPNKLVHKIKVIKPLPDVLAVVAGEAAHHLRSALDCAGYEVAVASGKVAPKNCMFPFARDVDNLKTSLGNAKDIPQEILAVMCAFQPYKGGDDLLWALNQIDICDKHKMLTPVGIAVTRGNTVELKYLADRDFAIEFPQPPRWDSAKKEIITAITTPIRNLQLKSEFTLLIAFDDIDVVKGQEAVPVLNALASKVESIVSAIEAEAVRIGLI